MISFKFFPLYVLTKNLLYQLNRRLSGTKGNGPQKLAASISIIF
jgi:hypothetical protein